MNGGTGLRKGRWTSLYAVPDFVPLTGLVTWIDEPAELDRRLPAPSGPKRPLARRIKLALERARRSRSLSVRARYGFLYSKRSFGVTRRAPHRRSMVSARISRNRPSRRVSR